jgi:orotidine-5'-phosphate decarboxylase
MRSGNTGQKIAPVGISATGPAGTNKSTINEHGTIPKPAPHFNAYSIGPIPAKFSVMPMHAEPPTPFADRLARAVADRGTPVLVGLDPRYEKLPAGMEPIGSPGGDRADWAGKAVAYRRFCEAVIDVVAPLVAVVKPQAAFFEELGPPGMTALKDVIDYARAKRLLVILDGKRNDIGTTAAAYATGYLGSPALSAWAADALTVSPYLGADSLDPFIDVATRRGAGIFVLVKTSNPGSGMFQDLLIDGQPLYRHVAKAVDNWSRQTQSSCGYGAVGAVVGATYPEELVQLRAAMPHTWLLVPGYGSQGASARDVCGAFDEHGQGAIINNSRDIIFAHSRKEYSQRFGAARWQDAVEAATRDMIDQLRAETPAGKL